jgi:uncharacterized protein YjiS (DUF1127 family)
MKEIKMLTNLKSAIRRAHERARLRRDYHFLLGQEDAILRDIGVDRSDLYHAVMHGRTTD